MVNNKKNNKKHNKKTSTRAVMKNEVKAKSKEVGAFDVVSGIGGMELASFVLGLLFLVFALFMFISFASYLTTGAADYSLLENATDVSNEGLEYKNACGSFGALLAHFFINRCFGLASFIIPPYLVILGYRMMRVYRVTLVRKFILMALLLIWTSVFLAYVGNLIPVLEESFLNLGGNHGKNVVLFLSQRVGNPGVFVVLVATGVLYLMYLSMRTVEIVRDALRLKFLKRKKKEIEDKNDKDAEEEDNKDDEPSEKPNDIPEDKPESEGEDVALAAEDNNAVTYEFDEEDLKTDGASGSGDLAALFDQAYQLNQPENANGENAEEEKEHELDIELKETEQGSGKIERGGSNTPYDPKLDLELYKYPELSLIKSTENAQQVIDPEEQNANKNRIIQVLRNFGVEISSIKATIGPTVTLYEIVPAEGVRISKIRNLGDDIALSLSADGVRIIAPIPGKGTIGIEVPNRKKCIVSMESVLNSKAYQESTMELPCAVGKTITNEVFLFDLAKAPHLLVAGATGQGKSVGLNAIIASLLYKKHPAELKIVMVDPKKVEFSIYNPIENHFLARLEEEDECIITDVQKVVKTLNSLCQLMDTRYDLLKLAKCRNIKEYNAKFKARELNPEHGHEFMPYVVVVVDEFGDLIMTAGKEVELPICRIAQLARAVGIHMIIATQRPQASIISGAIKTNFPARMAFKVSSLIDSRVVLDRGGAEQLIGRGDMLFLSGSDPVRVQCAFLDTPEVSNICNFIAKQQSYLHPMYLPEVIEDGGDDGRAGGVDVKHLDPLFGEVAKFVVNSQQGSTSMIQRNYSIGYNRAGKIMDQLERMGVVGPQVGSKPREVLIKDPLTLEGLLNTLG